ncbi:MAG: peptidase S10 [Chloroflexi bacterium]|nr:MAG: peptidase S10 [Chloroflexota bacterium]
MAEDEKTKNKDEENNTKDSEKKDEKPKEVPPVVTQHSITLDGETLEYTVTAGMMPLKNKDGDIEANIFFTAYTLNDVADVGKRPLCFVFNGGPGSASVWLHLGAIGPKRVVMQDEGWMPAPPYRLEDNAQTWLNLTDLVFIDPVGTGYSRAIKDEDNKNYWNLKTDIESVGEFIRLYLTRYMRWASPLFLAGESYGTTRAAGLSGHLFDKGIALNGIVLISTILNFQTARFTQGNDLPYILFLPTYTATAWYHNKLPDDLQKRAIDDVLKEVREWAETEYAYLLAKGSRLTDDERQTLITQLARFTGLAEKFIDHSDLRLHIQRFCKELLRDEKRTVGRLDSRFKGTDKLPVTEFPDVDPSMTAIMPPYTAMMNDYVRRELGYETDVEYKILSFEVNRSWEYERGEFPDTSEALRSALARNPFMKVFVAQGYYDLATPFFAAEYTINHAGIDPSLLDNIHFDYYEAGHMLYLDVTSLKKFKADVAEFLSTSSNIE